MKQLVFVGEKRSHRAISMRVTWLDGRLAGKTLFEALRAAGIDPYACLFVNLYRDGEGWEVDAEALCKLREYVVDGYTLVGLGKRVQTYLTRERVPHVALVHPAARGAIRGRAVYQAHVAETLGADVMRREAA